MSNDTDSLLSQSPSQQRSLTPIKIKRGNIYSSNAQKLFKEDRANNDSITTTTEEEENTRSNDREDNDSLENNKSPKRNSQFRDGRSSEEQSQTSGEDEEFSLFADDFERAKKTPLLRTANETEEGKQFRASAQPKTLSEEQRFIERTFSTTTTTTTATTTNHHHIQQNVLERMGRTSSCSSMISSQARQDEYGVSLKPSQMAKMDEYCLGFPVDQEHERAYQRQRKQLRKQKDKQFDVYLRYSRAKKEKTMTTALRRELAKIGAPERKRAKAWLEALKVKEKRERCDKTYVEYSQMSEREAFDRERASVRVDLINVFPDHPRFSLSSIDDALSVELNNSNSNSGSGGGSGFGLSVDISLSRAGSNASSVATSSPRSPTGLRGFDKNDLLLNDLIMDEDKDDKENNEIIISRTRSNTTESQTSESEESDTMLDDDHQKNKNKKEQPQQQQQENAIMQLLNGSFFEKLNMFPVRESNNNGKTNVATTTKENEYDDLTILPENYMDSTSRQYFGKMERVLMAFSARSPRDLEKSHVVIAAISLLVFKGDEENAFWTLVCLAEDVNLCLDEAEVTMETIVLEERTRHNSSLECVNTNLVTNKIFTQIGAGFFPPNVIMRILDAIVFSPPPLSSRLLHHVAYEFLYFHGEKLKDEEKTLEIANEAFDCDDLIINAMKMMSATETMKSTSALRILARQRVEMASGGFCGPGKGWTVALVSAKRMKFGEVSSKKKIVPGWSSDEDDTIRKTTRSCDFFGQFSPLNENQKGGTLNKEAAATATTTKEGGVQNEIKKVDSDSMLTLLTPVRTHVNQNDIDSADIMRFKFVIRGPNDVVCTMYRNRTDLTRLHEILVERKITEQLPMLEIPRSFTSKLTAGITKLGFSESQEYFIRLSKAGVPGLQKILEEFFELDSSDLDEYCYESDHTQGSFDDY